MATKKKEPTQQPTPTDTTPETHADWYSLLGELWKMQATQEQVAHALKRWREGARTIEDALK